MTSYDRLQRRKYWRAMDKFDLVCKIGFALLVVGVLAYMAWYSNQIDTMYGANAPLIVM